MSKFSIEIIPDIPQPEEPIHFENIDNLSYQDIGISYEEEYEIIYHIGEESFQYYPSGILTILYDLYDEWKLVRSKTPHSMRLSGYTVLEIDFEGEAVIFKDPMEWSRHGVTKKIGEPIWVLAVEEAFRAAIERVIGLIQRAK